jgi:trehalose synthase
MTAAAATALHRTPAKPFYFNTSAHLSTIGGAVGGIPNQIVDKMTGMLVHSVEGCTYQIRYLLTHPEFAAQLGRNGREHVKENFLMTTDVRRWLLLLQILLRDSRRT